MLAAGLNYGLYDTGRAIESLSLKVGTVGDYFYNLTLTLVLFGQSASNAQQPVWLESALLDLMNDIGIVGVVMLCGVSLTSGLKSSFSQLWFFSSSMFYALFFFSNSTLNPPVLIVFIICMAYLTTNDRNYNRRIINNTLEYRSTLIAQSRS